MKYIQDGFKYFPDEIIRALIDIAHIDDETIDFNKCVNALYDLRAICENEYNADYYTHFYRLLARVAEEYNRT